MNRQQKKVDRKKRQAAKHNRRQIKRRIERDRIARRRLFGLKGVEVVRRLPVATDGSFEIPC